MYRMLTRFPTTATAPPPIAESRVKAPFVVTWYSEMLIPSDGA